MSIFFETYGRQIVYGIGVIALMLVLFLLTDLVYKWMIRKGRNRFPNAKASSLNLIKLIFNTLWLVLGIIALSSLFVQEDAYGMLQNQFKLVLYLGFLAFATIIAAASANLWFKKRIDTKVLNHDDPTAFKFLGNMVVFSIYFMGLLFGLLAFPSLRGVAQTALGGAGILALIAGISSQEALSNLVGGLFIISFKPFKIGDVIKISDTMVGTVSDITLRHTVIRDSENRMIVIPNSIINKEKLINYDLGGRKICKYIEIGISYDSDVGLAKKILREECEKHPLIYDNRTHLDKKDGKPMVRTALTALNDFSVTIRAWAWARSYGDSFTMQCDVFESAKRRFAEEGIEIPYPYRTVIIKKEDGSID